MFKLNKSALQAIKWAKTFMEYEAGEHKTESSMHCTSWRYNAINGNASGSDLYLSLYIIK